MGRILLLSVVAAFLVAVSPPPPVAAAPPPGVVASRCEPTSEGYRCLVGPISVPAGQRVEFMTGVAAPSEAGWLTSARASLVDAAGEEVAHDAVHLHHAVWLNPYAKDLTCDAYDEGLPGYERFFASGGERTPVVLPDGYGYRWQPPVAQPHTQSTPFWGFVGMLDGKEGQADTFVELEVGFLSEAEAEAMVPIRPLWLDVRNCESHPVFGVEKGSGTEGVHAETWETTMPLPGRFVFLGGHLHAGGLGLRLDNATTGQELFVSEPVYGKPGHPWCLTGMTTWADPTGQAVAAGDQLRLTALYDSTRDWHHVMGIMLGAVVPDEALPPGTPPLPQPDPGAAQPHHAALSLTPLAEPAADPCMQLAAAPAPSSPPPAQGQQPPGEQSQPEPAPQSAALPATGGGAPAAGALLLVAAAAALVALQRNPATRRSAADG